MIKSVVDIGTNSTRLLVARKENGAYKELLRKTTITRLGEGLNNTGKIKIEAAERTAAVINDYRQLAGKLGSDSISAFATQALREAKNADRILEFLKERTGLTPRVLSGSEEALCSFLGAVMDLGNGRFRMVVDIGGGSTEFAAGTESPEFAVSTQLGCVRLMEMFGLEKAAGEEKVREVRNYIVSELSKHIKAESLSIKEAVFVGGTATTIAAIILGLKRYDRARVHLSRIDRKSMEKVALELASLNSDERSRYRVIEKERLPVISAGALIMHSIIDYFGFREIIVSEKDVLDGYLVYENGLE